ncbi:MAG: double-transrane region domain protein, partial [Planctomycetaceae bacterium]|nr:double-transrane region domain protein [Planctomycetaceae bacterium]
ATHLVAILDHSASMQGQADGEPSFRDSAIQELEQRFAKLPRQSAVTLIRTGSRPVTLIRRGAVDQAREVLKTWQPTAPQHRIESAWEELGEQLVEESGSILFLTDNMPEPNRIPKNLEIVSVGRKLDNVAFDAARWTFDSGTGKGTVFVRVQNYGRSAAECVLVATAKGKEVLRKPLAMAAEKAQAVELPVPGGLGALTLSIEKTVDGSRFDNQIQLVEPKVRSVKLTVLLPKGESQREIQRVLKITPDVSLTGLADAQLIIGPAGVLPESRPGLWWLGIGPISTQEADSNAAKDLLGPYLIDKRHPLADGVVLGGVVWGGVQPVKYDAIPIISAGQTPLLAQLRGTQTTAFLLNIDLAKSNIVESPDWPVLIDNLVEQRRDALPGLRRWNYRVGEVVQFRLFEGPDPTPTELLTLISAAGTRKITRESIVEIGDLQDPGIYELKAGEKNAGQFAINFFDPAESDLRNLTPGRHSPKIIVTDSGITLDNPYTWAIWIGTILILALLFADWFVLRPRPVK